MPEPDFKNIDFGIFFVYLFLILVYFACLVYIVPYFMKRRRIGKILPQVSKRDVKYIVAITHYSGIFVAKLSLPLFWIPVYIMSQSSFGMMIILQQLGCTTKQSRIMLFVFDFLVLFLAAYTFYKIMCFIEKKLFHWFHQKLNWGAQNITCQNLDQSIRQSNKNFIWSIVSSVVILCMMFALMIILRR